MIKTLAKKVLKKVWRQVIRVGKRYRITNDLLENKIFPLINRYKHGNSRNVRVSVHDLYNAKFKLAKPFKVKRETRQNVRINILYNDFDKKSFFGGKATALIIANMLASECNYDLRIIGTNIRPEVYTMFLEVFGMKKVEGVEFCDFEKNNSLEVSDNDFFIATNGFNARSVLDNDLVKNRDKIFYIMQEVETMFYDHGDDYLFMSRTMKHSSMVPIVNTKLLYDWFCANGYTSVINNGIFFEPAFPLGFQNQNVNKRAEKPYKLFYYGRPAHQRNLFYFGVKTLNQAFLTGALNPHEWVVYVSDDGTTPLFSFDADVKVERLKPMSWVAYNEFVRSVDLAYSMIYTPHPSYPPLDTAMLGGVCVTNTYSNKKTLSSYSKNIIAADLNEDAMLAALEKADKLVKNDELRKKNYLENNINTDWYEALQPTIKYMKEKIENV